MAMMTWKTEKSLLSLPDDARRIDNYWDLLPIEIKTMIVDMVKREDEANAKAYWKVCFTRVLGHLISFTHCKHCGRSKVPSMSYYDHTFESSHFMLCPTSYYHLVYIFGRSLKSLTEEYWKGNPTVWKRLKYQ